MVSVSADQRRGLTGHLVAEGAGRQHDSKCWRRREPPIELPLDRDDVLAIFDALVDIKSRTLDIWNVIVGEDESDEDEP
jgi:hypothetical protein